MALLGCYGKLVFECSRSRMHTFSDLTVKNAGRYGQHDVHLELPVLEWVGPGLTEVSFKMNFSRQWNADPFASIAFLRIYAKTGVVAPLLVGNRPIVLGFNLWVLTELGEEHKWFSKNGDLFGASVDVSLKEYRLMI